MKPKKPIKTEILHVEEAIDKSPKRMTVEQIKQETVMLNHHRNIIGKTKGPEAELNLKLQFEKYRQIIGLNKRIKVSRKSPAQKTIATN